MNLSFVQKPSRYINREINTVCKDTLVKVALAFPDLYEIGMSHLGLKILYKIINNLPFASAERVFSPWIDLESEMKSKGMLLSSLESTRPLRDFDIVGFSLQYELSYTTVLNMLSLGGIPLKTEERMHPFPNRIYPIVIAGGPCTVNPLPLSPFMDAFLIGDGEEAIFEILDTYYEWKKGGDGKKESLLQALSNIEGLYVPTIHNPSSPLVPNSFGKGGKVGFFIKRRFIQSLDAAPYPDKPLVPHTAIVHDRVNIEVSRGCSMGCRFCQAGMIYRPVRERSPERVLELAENSLRNTGYEEVAFTSLSAGDYSCLLEVIREFNKRFFGNNIAISLPSLRVASVNRDILKEIRSIRKTGFTIAPEAGTDRLRRVINKDFSEKNYEESLKILFDEGWLNLKLYFMIGLPTETEEDIESIIKMSLQAMKIARQHTKRFVNINIGVSPFIPKAHTPFQWYGQSPSKELERKKTYIKKILLKKGFNIKGHDIELSLLEAAFSRGDERLAELLEKAWSLGCRLDGWTEVFDFEIWEKAMNLTGIDVTDYAQKHFAFSDVLPWDFIDIRVSKEFLWTEYENALAGIITTDCSKVCHNCGLQCKPAISNLRSEIRNTESAHRPSIGEHKTHKSFKPVKIRFEFSKTGRLRYLSHLELSTLMQRAFRRADFPLVYSKGFHPSPKISFGPPLPVGVAGLSEYLDLEIVPPLDLEFNRKKINTLLPDGIYIKNMSVLPANAKSLHSFITRYEYEIKGKDVSNIFKLLSEKEIFIKRDNKTINIRNMVEEAKFIDDKTVHVLLIDMEDVKVRLGEILPVMFYTPLENLDITRIALYGWDEGWTKPLLINKIQFIDSKI